MNRHALEVLQYPEALRLIAAFASSPLGANAILSMQPSAARGWIVEELRRVEELALLLQAHDWAMPAIPDCRESIRLLDTSGSVLEASALRDLGQLMRSAEQARAAFHAEPPLMARLVARIGTFEADEAAIRRTIDDAGEVRDGASKELARLRRAIRGARGRIVQQLEHYMTSLPARLRVGDASVTVREGRYVIPVRREGRTEVGGLVHDESATGQTLFVEPPVAIELMNRLRELEIAEAREVLRILRERTDALRPSRDALRVTLEALVELDSVTARARFAVRYDGSRPELGTRDETGYDVRHGRHPLLLAGDSPVVPFDLRLEPAEHTLLVSGPNTGGKTVLLKAAGLISALTQSGVIPPVGAGTRVPVFGDIFADIGDEQSIEASLSTFSAHLRNLNEIVDRAQSDSLVLIDEMGSGTDPVEGAALAKAILVELTQRGALTVATTHLGELKQLSADHAGVVNASLEFDSVELRPTFALRKGVPGRSYGLAIARRLGFPAAVLQRAESMVPDAERRLSTLLEEVEAKERALSNALREAERAGAEGARLRSEVEAREAAIEVRERTAERRAKQQARDLLLGARADVESAIRELREAVASAADEEERERAVRAARRRVEERARALSRRPVVRDGGPERNGIAEPAELHVGDRVRIDATGAEGTLLELREDRAFVDVGGIRLQVAASGLVAAGPAGGPAGRATRRSASPAWTGPDFEAASEIDVRGLRADEVGARLQPAIDAAVQAALRSLRIIHGKGTGALREVVAEQLRQDGRVASFRAGGTGEGGTGVTVAELR